MANQLPTGVWWHFNQLSPYPVTGGDGISVYLLMVKLWQQICSVT